ncbi:MAG: 50S ribosomal protein L13 [Desulfurococcales archaeon]|nr:50S ribosomal protein L13 [Desulfurococcales archaeon]
MSAEARKLRRTIIIDAEGAILGRLCTHIAKALQEGFKIYVVNAEKAVVSGEKLRVIEGYKVWLRIKTLRNPQKRSPRRPRTPEAIIKRTVKGMLPKNFQKGLEALRNLKVFVGIPKEFEGKEMVKLSSVSSEKLGREYITVGEIAKALGWKG